MANVKRDVEIALDGSQEDAALKARRPWTAPMVLISTVSRQTNKALDYLPEGHAGGSTIIS